MPVGLHDLCRMPMPCPLAGRSIPRPQAAATPQGAWAVGARLSITRQRGGPKEATNAPLLHLRIDCMVGRPCASVPRMRCTRLVGHEGSWLPASHLIGMVQICGRQGPRPDPHQPPCGHARCSQEPAGLLARTCWLPELMTGGKAVVPPCCWVKQPGMRAWHHRRTSPHTALAGPVVAEAIFLNREEVPVQPLYYDPGVCFSQLNVHAAPRARCGSCVGGWSVQVQTTIACRHVAAVNNMPLALLTLWLIVPAPALAPSRSARLWVHAI